MAPLNMWPFFALLLVAAEVSNGEVSSRRGFAWMESIPCKANDVSRPVLDIIDVLIRPNPIELPGPFRIQAEFKMHSTIQGQLSLSLEVHKRFNLLFGLYTWIKIPCLASGIGSCSYDDLCSLAPFNTTECMDLDSVQMTECQCPYTAGTWRLPANDFHIYEIPDLPAFLLEGEFLVKATVKRGEKALACHSMKVKLNLQD